MERALRLAVLLETVTVVVLLANLATVHDPTLASLVGPLHGTAYLVVIALVLGTAGASRRATALSVVPVLGGWLALRELSRG